MSAEVVMSVSAFVAVVIGAIALGAAGVMSVAWNRSYRAAHRLMDLLDTVGEEERQLRARLASTDKEGASRWDR